MGTPGKPTRKPPGDPPRSLRVGLLSDTHGLLRPEAVGFLSGCDYILHGGDVGAAAILEALEAIAPVIAVRGNNDTGPWASRLRETEMVRIGNLFAYLIHDLAALDIEPGAAGVGVVVSGHSHRPLIRERDGILYVNPGSCGPRRFKLPVTAAELRVSPDGVDARIHQLDGGA